MSTSPDPLTALEGWTPPRRRRWPWFLLAISMVMVLGAWFFAPRWAARVLHATAPLPSGDVVIRGAQFGGEPPPAMLIGVCNRATLHAIWEGASGRWQPSFIIGDGQHVWGTLTLAPEITWRLDIDDSVPEPRISATIPALLAERLLRQQVSLERTPISAVRIHSATLTGEPAGLTTTWLLNLSGEAQVTLGNHPVPVQLTRADLRLDTTLLPQAHGPSQLSASATLTTLQGDIPLVGNLAPWRGFLEKQLNQRLRQEMPKTLVPEWWPPATHWELKIVPSAMREF